VPVDDLDTAGALSPDARTLVLVHVNPGLVARRLALPKGWRVRMILTDATHDAVPVSGTTVASRAIATLILER
jgi:hypothetical protein